MAASNGVYSQTGFPEEEVLDMLCVDHVPHPWGELRSVAAVTSCLLSRDLRAGGRWKSRCGCLLLLSHCGEQLRHYYDSTGRTINRQVNDGRWCLSRVHVRSI